MSSINPLPFKKASRTLVVASGKIADGNPYPAGRRTTRALLGKASAAASFGGPVVRWNRSGPSRKATEDWTPLGELLAKLPPPTDTPPEPAPGKVSEEPKRAPSAPPGVTHLPPRRQDTSNGALPSEVGAQAKRTILIGPTAPAAPSPSGQASSSTVTTSPLAPAVQGTKKMSRATLVKALAQKTAPLPTKVIVPPSPRGLPSPSRHSSSSNAGRRPADTTGAEKTSPCRP